MSITFSVRNMPQENETHDCCNITDCYHYHGTGTVSFDYDKYEINVSNSNGYKLLAALELPIKCAGEAKAEDVLHKATEYLLLRQNRDEYIVKRLRQIIIELVKPALEHGQTEIYWS